MMQTLLRLVSVVARLIACAAIAAGQTAHAQQAVELQRPELPRTDAASPDAQLGVVYVTARRRSEALDQVPVSVLVVSGDDLQKMGATRFEDYAGSLPGLGWDNSLGFLGARQFIRGITSGLVPAPNPLIQVYIGDTPVAGYQGPGGGNFPNMNPIDVQSIELLRGPQGTLFGSNAMGGALRILPNDPNLVVRSGWVEASALHVTHGGDGYNLSGVLNLPIVEGTSALRLVAFGGNDGGWITNDALHKSNINAQDSSGGRVAYRWRDLDWTVDAKVFFQHDHQDGFNMSEVGEPRYHQDRRSPERFDDRWILSNLTVERDSGDLRLISTTSYLSRDKTNFLDTSNFVDQLFSVNSTSMQDAWERWGELTQEVRAQGQAGKTDWLLGAFYQRRHYLFSQSAPAPGFDASFDQANPGAPDAAAFGYPDNLGPDATRVRQEQIAVFADVSFHPISKVELTAGVRRFHFSQAFNSFGDGIQNGGPTQSSSADSESGTTPRVSAAWHPEAHQTWYASIARGFRPGGPNDPNLYNYPGCGAELATLGYSATPGPTRSDRLINYEIGSKVSSADRSIELNTSLFHIDWSGIQTQHLLNCGSIYVENAGKATSDGAEADLTAHFAHVWTLALNAAYTDARFRRDVPDLGAKSGDRLAGVPNYTAALALTWNYASKSYARLDYQRTGKSVNSYDTFGAPDVPAYGNLNFAVAHSIGHWQFSGRIKNVLDSYSAVSRQRSFLGQWDTTLPPRTFILSASYTW